MEYLLECLLGLGLFLYGIKIMSEALKKVVGDKMKMIINKATANPFMGILIGFLLTTLIQSSSGTCALVVSLITAGLLNLNAAIFIILGANIGSPTTSIIIGLDITKYANKSYPLSINTNNNANMHSNYDINAIRLYNKALSDSEVLANYNYQQSLVQ